MTHRERAHALANDDEHRRCLKSGHGATCDAITRALEEVEGETWREAAIHVRHCSTGIRRETIARSLEARARAAEKGEQGR